MEKPRTHEVDATQIDLSVMPPLMREICKTIGVTDGLKLIEAYGGRRLYVNSTACPDCPLARVISMEALQKLVARFAGARLHLTKIDKVHIQLKHRLLHEMKAAKKPASAIAETLGYSERRVYQLTSKPLVDEKNRDLFEP